MKIIEAQNRQSVVFYALQIIASFLVFAILMGCAGDTKMGSGAKTGAAIGAGIGLLIGIASGDADKAVAGAAIGAGIGAGEGAYEGWKQDQDDERTRQITDAIRESNKSGESQEANADTETQAREELTRFLGIWTMEGWVQEPGEQRLNVQARVNADIQMNYFVELAYIDLKITGLEKQIWGTSTIGYDKIDGYNITTRLNALPEPMRAMGGTFDPSSRSFTFKGPDYRLIFLFQSPDRFTVETFATSGGSEQKLESYTFTRA